MTDNPSAVPITEPVPGTRDPVPGTRNEDNEPHIYGNGVAHNAEEAPKEPKNWTHYVHLANGEVVKANAKIRNGIAEMGNVFRRNGHEHHVIGIYPKENEYTEPVKDDDE